MGQLVNADDQEGLLCLFLYPVFPTSATQSFIWVTEVVLVFSSSQSALLPLTHSAIFTVFLVVASTSFTLLLSYTRWLQFTSPMSSATCADFSRAVAFWIWAPSCKVALALEQHPHSVASYWDCGQLTCSGVFFTWTEFKPHIPYTILMQLIA